MAWNVNAGAPYVTVSARGLSNGASVPNDGADFGPDTSNTTTSGIQEALNVIVNGGTVYVQRGDYTLNNPIYQTGNYQVVNFEAGTTLSLGLSFPVTTPLTSWVGVITVAWNAASTVAYHHCYWYGNGTTCSVAGHLAV